MKQNISRVLEKDVCCGCGTCAGICPTGAINLIICEGLFVPLIDENKCTECKLCVECCPSYSVDYSGFNLELFGNQLQNSLIGNWL